MDCIQSKISNLLKSLLVVDELNLAHFSFLNELPGWDSMRYIQFVNLIEKNFGIELDFESIIKIQKISAIEGVIAEKSK